VTSETLAGAPSATYPADALADKLLAASNAKSAATVPSATAPAAPPSQVASLPAAGPYDPNAYKPAYTAPADTYGGANQYAASAPSATGYVPSPAAPNAPPPLASDPADKYGYTPSSAQTTPTPDRAPLMDPAAVAADKYSNPSLPTMPDHAAQPLAPAPGAVAAQPGAAPLAAPAASGVRLASAPGQYRPGRTSSYTGSTNTTGIEVASRPASPAAAAPAQPAGAIPGAQPWTPPTTGTPPQPAARY
jgi:hypothetical protein